eukprot:2695109-Heterocapsa_arctica.AAC.1
MRSKNRVVVITNQWPWRQAAFPTLQQAKQHASRTIGGNKPYSIRRHTSLSVLYVPTLPRCPLCSQIFERLE